LATVLPGLLFAAPAFALVEPGLADPAEPGSVIIYPKFATGSVAVDGGAFNAAKTLIEVGVVCPAGLAPCAHIIIPIHFHWVCPGATVAGVTNVCQETDFTVLNSIFGKITFNPSQLTGPLDGNTAVPIAPCQRGYLIGWVVDFTDSPIKFDGLIGDSVQRNTPQDLQSYSALAIQGDPADPNGFPVTQVVDPATGILSLAFDGGAHHYQMATGQLQGDVRYDSNITAPFGVTSLILLTLDVRSNLTNAPVLVPIDFYTENQFRLSTATAFVCWNQIILEAIDPGLTVENMRVVAGGGAGLGIKGVFVTGQARQNGLPSTMLGLVQTIEGPVAVNVTPALATRSYTTRPENNSIPVPTTFVPF